MRWHEWVNPQYLPLWVQRMLNEGEKLHLECGTLPTTEDKYSAMAEFLREGPYTEAEVYSLRTAIGPHL